MDNKKPSFSFADLTPPSTMCLLIAMTTLASSSAYPSASVLLGIIAVIFGIIALREINQEKYERRVTWFGISVSIISIILTFINFYR